MPGPPPKPSSQRRRRNRSTTPVKLAGAKTKRKTPALPIRGATAATKAWWKTIWASPMAAAWLAADVPGLVRLAGLVERAQREKSPPLTVLSEIRQLEDRYGLSPLARRRLQWEVDQAGAAAPAGEKDGGDDSRWLRAVSD